MARLLVCLVCGLACSLSQAGVTDGLIAHWTFDEGSGNIAYDYVGGNHGQIHGAQWIDGRFGGALAFNGASDYVAIGNVSALDFGPQDFTIALWFRVLGEHSSNLHEGEGMLFSKYDWFLANRQWSIKHLPSGHVPFYTSPDGKTHESLWSNTTDTFGRWVHIAVVRQGNTKYIYVDGELDVTGPTSGLASGLNAEVYSRALQPKRFLLQRVDR